MSPNQLKNSVNEVAFERMKAQELAFRQHSYVLQNRQRIYKLIAAEVTRDLAAENTNRNKPAEVAEKITIVISPVTRTMQTELQTIER